MNRIIYFVNIPRFFVSHRLPLALAARDAGYNVHVTTSSDDEVSIQRIVDAGLPFHPLPLSQHGTNPVNEWNTLRAVTRLYHQLQPDIVHHVSIKPVIYGGIAAQRARVRGVVGAVSGLGYVFTSDDTKARLLRLGVQPAYRFALRTPNTRMIFQNPDDRQRFLDMGIIDVPRTVLIRGSGVDTNVFTSHPATETDLPLVIFAGRLLWKKGIQAFVDAAQGLQGRARFAIVGYPEASSPDAVPLNILEGWHRQGVIEFWGRRDDMPQVFAQSHIVCLPSTYGEGVPKVLIEAAACSRPIVTTDTAGCREIVEHEQNGILVAPDDQDALVAALERLIKDAPLRNAMGQKGRQLVQAEFSLEKVVSQTLQVYEELLT